MCKDKRCPICHDSGLACVKCNPHPETNDDEAREVVDEIEEELSPELEELYAMAAHDQANREIVGLPSTDEASARGRVTGRVNKEDGTKLGRNDPCPCHSGKKYKKCCGG